MLRFVLFLAIVPVAAYFISATASSAQNTVLLQGQPSPTQLQAYNLMQQAMSRLQSKQNNEAKALLDQAAALWPDMPHLHYYCGFACQGLGEYDRAIKEFQQAIQSDPSRFDCMVNIATCYQLMGQPGNSAQWFEKYLQAKPNASNAEQIRTMIKALKKQPDRAAAPGAAGSDNDYLANISINGTYRRWSLNRMPLKIYISPGLDGNGRRVNGFRDQYGYDLCEALNQWVSATQGRISYTVEPNIQQADIHCFWTDDPSLQGAGGNQVEQGTAERNEQQWPDGTVTINRARVVVLVQARDGSGPLDDNTMKKACLHEIGHALGLAGHSMNNQDIMFYSNSPLTTPLLTLRDKATIARLYGDYPAAPMRQ